MSVEHRAIKARMREAPVAVTIKMAEVGAGLNGGLNIYCWPTRILLKGFVIL
jgi:hypothetical protein